MKSTLSFLPQSAESDNKYKDFEWAINLNKISLQMMGIWPESDKFKKYSDTFRVPMMILMKVLFLNLPQLYALYIVSNYFDLVIDNLMITLPCLISGVKLFFMWKNERVYKSVIDLVLEDWLRSKKIWEIMIMKREAGRAKLFTTSGYMIIMLCYLGFVVPPALNINIRIVNNLTDINGQYLVVQSYFPFDYSPSPRFQIIFAGQTIAAFFIGVTVVVPENFFVALISHLSAQFDILGQKIENIVSRYQNHDTLAAAEFKYKVKLVVQRHIVLINAVQSIETSFCYVIVCQLVLMTGMVVCLSFQVLRIIGTTEDKPPLIQLGVLLSTLITMLMYTFVDCWASEALTIKASEIYQKAFNSRWYTVPRREMRDLILIMLISKKTRPLKTGKIFTLSLVSYCQILRRMAGYISVLIAVSQ